MGREPSFGDVGLEATSSDVANVTIYASVKTKATDEVVMIAVSKAPTDKQVAITLAHPTTFAALQVYRLAGLSAEITKQADQASIATNAWKLKLPAQSVNVLVPTK